MMDKKKSFGKRVIRNNVEVMNQFPQETGYDQAYQQQNNQNANMYDQYNQMQPEQYQQAPKQEYPQN